VISKQPPLNDNNNHQAIFKFNGDWYEAYHNRFVAKEAKVPATYKRNLCLDMFKHNPDGTIEVMANTVDGLKQQSYLNPFERVEAETINAQNGIKTEISSAGGMSVCNIENGDWIKVKGVNFGKTGAKTFSASVAGNGGQIQISIDKPSEKPIGVCKVTPTGGTQESKIRTCKLAKITGVHDVYFKFIGGSVSLFNFDWWKFI